MRFGLIIILVLTFVFSLYTYAVGVLFSPQITELIPPVVVNTDAPELLSKAHKKQCLVASIQSIISLLGILCVSINPIWRRIKSIWITLIGGVFLLFSGYQLGSYLIGLLMSSLMTSHIYQAENQSQLRRLQTYFLMQQVSGYEGEDFSNMIETDHRLPTVIQDFDTLSERQLRSIGYVIEKVIKNVDPEDHPRLIATAVTLPQEAYFSSRQKTILEFYNSLEGVKEEESYSSMEETLRASHSEEWQPYALYDFR